VVIGASNSNECAQPTPGQSACSQTPLLLAVHIACAPIDIMQQNPFPDVMQLKGNKVKTTLYESPKSFQKENETNPVWVQ